MIMSGGEVSCGTRIKIFSAHRLVDWLLWTPAIALLVRRAKIFRQQEEFHYRGYSHISLAACCCQRQRNRFYHCNHHGLVLLSAVVYITRSLTYYVTWLGSEYWYTRGGHSSSLHKGIKRLKYYIILY